MNNNEIINFELIHIGKCGGGTLLDAFELNKIKFIYDKVHVKKHIFNNY